MVTIHTRQGRALFAAALYLTAVTVTTYLEMPRLTEPVGLFRALELFLRVGLLAVILFPSGFGFEALEWLLVLPHAVYVWLIINIVRADTAMKFFRWAVPFVALLSLNVYGCAFTHHGAIMH
jgi:hypothetical protein